MTVIIGKYLRNMRTGGSNRAKTRRLTSKKLNYGVVPSYIGFTLMWTCYVQFWEAQQILPFGKSI